jgi:hypothetical protein
MPGKALKIHLGKNKGPPFGEWAPFGKNHKGEPILRNTATNYTPEKAL